MQLRIGFGLPQTGKFLDAGIPVGLSVDTVELSGNADMFGIMKVTQNVENGVTESEFKLNARRVLHGDIAFEAVQLPGSVGEEHVTAGLEHTGAGRLEVVCEIREVLG